MNYIIKAQITNMIAMTKAFEQSCRMAAQMDNGIINRTEMKTIQKISAATNKYIAELDKLKDQGGYLDFNAIAGLFRRGAA